MEDATGCMKCGTVLSQNERFEFYPETSPGITVFCLSCLTSLLVGQLNNENKALKKLIRNSDMGQTACVDCEAHEFCMRNGGSGTCAETRIKWAIAVEG